MRKFFFLLIVFAGAFCISSHAQTLACPPNIDFEYGNYTMWHYYTGTCCPINTPTAVVPPTLNRFDLMSTTAGPLVDPFGGFPTVGAGLYSLRLGTCQTDYYASKAMYFVYVPAGVSNYSLIYKYAVVLEDPGHSPSSQPRFTVQAYDVTGYADSFSTVAPVLPCANFNYVAGSLPGFTGPLSTDPYGGCPGGFGPDGGPGVYYKSWSTASINLGGLGGHTIRMEFAAGDCGLGGHWGYGYVDMTCGLFAISTIAGCGSSSVQLIAPAGFASYAWYDSSTLSILYGTTDTITVPAPSVTTGYAVIVTPTPGFGCPDTLYTTVYPSSYVPAITGIMSVCVGGTTTLSDSAPGGTWSTTNISIATIGSGTGIVTGVTTGTSVVTYSLPGGCYTTATVTVTPQPSAIAGATNICAGSTTALSEAIGGGVWSSNNTAVATISGAGVVTGILSGTATISYSVGPCSVGIVITVGSLPAIAGTTNICAGSTTTLSDATMGGVWSSNNGAVATISGAGVAYGVTTGTTAISYTVGSCSVGIAITVVTPSAITGVNTVCAGSTITLSDTPPGGTWSLGSPGTATITPGTGIVTGVSAGTSTITYAVGAGCVSTATITVDPVSYTIGGSESVCAGNTAALSNATTGGTWSSNNTTIATVTAGTGIVTGVSGGTATITYFTGACNATTTTILVNPVPSAITGITSMCAGSATTLSDAVGGGTWSSSNTSIATIGLTTGIVTGSTTGSSTITYAMPGGCFKITSVTVYPTPTAITGAAPVCARSAITLSDAISGGVWSSGTPAVATVSGTGVVTGVAGGIAVISYSTGIGCSVTTTVDVTPLPDAGIITGAPGVCAGSTVNLTDSVAGGVWSISNGSATLSGSAVTGVSPGTDTISYSVTNSCGTATVTTVIAVVLPPDAGTISGNTIVCADTTALLSDTATGGVWSSSNNAVATVSGGVVYPVSAGTVTITYSVTNACSTATATITITVYPLPDAGIISGPATVCVGATFTLSETVTGGIWSSSNSLIATISSSGNVHALSPGVTIITYTKGANAGGCYGIATYTVTVSSTPDFTVGSNVSQITCYGENDGSIGLTVTGDAQIQYEWSNGNGSSSVTGLATGTYTVTVTDTTTQCKAQNTFTITEPDSIGIIPTIVGDLCDEGTGSIGLAVTGGTGRYTYLWSNGKTDSAITGLTEGIYSVTVTDNNGCNRNMSVTVNEDTCSDIIIYNAITPNGDGINDTWVIKGIENYPTNTVQVYDKWGDMVYEKSDYKNDWDGKGKKGEVPDGTYYYLVKLNAKNAVGTQNVWTGYLMIKR